MKYVYQRREYVDVTWKINMYIYNGCIDRNVHILRIILVYVEH